MRIVATFDPSLTTSDTFNAGFPNGVGRIVVYNESNVNLQLSWGSFSTYCPAWTAMLYCISTSNVNINWQQQSTLVSTGAPISQVIVEAFDNNETIVGTFPAALVRQTNIGNTVSTAMGGSTSLQNDGNTQTTIIEATPSGAGSSTISIDNEGNVTIKGNNAGVLTTLLQLIAGASPAVKLAAAAVLVEALGNIKIDGTLTALGASSLDNGAITTDGSGNFNTIGSKTTLNGSIAGTLQYSFPFWGTGIKLMIVTLHGYNSTLKNIPLPSSLSRGWIVATDLGGGTPVLQPKVGATLVGFNAVTGLGGAGNGTQSSVSNVKQDSMGSINSTIDNFDFTPGGVADGTIIMIGH